MAEITRPEKLRPAPATGKARLNHILPGILAIQAAEHKSLIWLSAMAMVSALIYGLVFLPMASLPALVETSHLDLFKLPQGGPGGLLRLLLAFTALGLAYWRGWQAALQVRGKIAWAIVLGGSLACGALLLFVYPFGAADVFENILHGRILGLYGANPFTRTASQFASDPFFGYVIWKHAPSAYGPVWELLAALVARLGAGRGLLANVLLFKALPGFFLLGSLGLLALILRRLDRPDALAGVLLLAWNPIVLWETWGNGHNDMAMVFWMLGAALLLLQRRYTLGTLALLVGALVKFIPLLLIPLALVYALKNLPALRQRWRFLTLTGMLGMLLAVAAYAPFWQGPQVLGILHRTQLYSSSLPASAFYLLQQAGWPAYRAAQLVSRAALGLMLLFILLQSLRLWKKPAYASYLALSLQVLLFYLLAACLWFQDWYSLWLLGLAPLLLPGPTRQLALLFSFAALSKPFGIGPLLFWPHPGWTTPRLEQPWLEITFTLGVLGLPWLYGLVSTWRSQHAHNP